MMPAEIYHSSPAVLRLVFRTSLGCPGDTRRSSRMRAARAFHLPPPVLPEERVMMIEALAAPGASVRKNFLAVHVHDAAAGFGFTVHALSSALPFPGPARVKNERLSRPAVRKGFAFPYDRQKQIRKIKAFGALPERQSLSAQQGGKAA